jgi:hypothetical protein
MAWQPRESRAQPDRPSPTGGNPGTAASSTALGLAAVTALLKSLLENGLAQRAVTSALGGDAPVSAIPPDRVHSGADERAQLNLFLYHVTPHTGLAIRGGGSRALAFDLHYLLSAYGAHDYQAEILLGHALQLLNETPVIATGAIRDAITSLSANGNGGTTSPAVAAIAASDAADRIHGIEITPEFLGTEEMSRLWSALQARYRPSATFKVSGVVLARGSAR